MLGPEKIKELTTQVFALSKADQTEVLVTASERALTRFANSYIHQNVAETNAEVRVRVVYGKKIGVASTNDLSPEGLKRAADTARVIAMLQPDNPDFTSLPSPAPIQNVETYVERTANFSPDQRAHAVSVLCKKAKARGVVAAGAFTTASFEVAVANSLGVFAYHPGSLAEMNTVMMTDNGSGYAARAHADARQINAEAIADEAISKALKARNPTDLEAGEYTVLLEEYAVVDVLNFLDWLSFSAQAVQEDRSFMKGKLGEKVMSENVTIWDDGAAGDAIALPFDYEGVPRQRVTLIEKGIARGIVYDTATAAKDGVASTGHSLPAPNSDGPSAMHLFMAPGETKKSEMLKGVERGVWVTRFWYTRVVHPLQVLITGMTRDGTFLIENGEITRPVKNFRFTTSYLAALNHVRAISQETKLFHEDWSNASRSVPAILVDGFQFTGVTQF
ncbi:MAG: TldD/PmbA family protein [Chloroflexi bacterium]|nr:TldD/PmbA family protein [Chloroflexota bacterium]